MKIKKDLDLMTAFSSMSTFVFSLVRRPIFVINTGLKNMSGIVFWKKYFYFQTINNLHISFHKIPVDDLPEFV